MSAILKNGLTPGSENPTFVSTVLLATASAMHNGPVLQEEREGGHEHPSKFSSTLDVTLE